MRGKGISFHSSESSFGITPAYAGKRSFPLYRPLNTQDHPRVCGEKVFVVAVVLNEPGSPPRMRGKATGERARTTKRRITPAYAGKSRLCDVL